MHATHEDFAADAHRLAMELECLLLSTKDTAALSRWWDSAHEALEQHRQLVRETLEQPEQKAECDGGTCGLGGYCDGCPNRPVAWQWLNTAHFRKKLPADAELRAWNPLFTHPPRREWQGLTEEEISDIFEAEPRYHYPPICATDREFARAIEAALKEKNHE